jgi:type IV secretory pathway TrbL component
MSNELFVELSDEQQEIVAGGQATLALFNASSFVQDTVVGTSLSQSGPGGSSSGSSGGAQHTASGSFSILYASAS